MSNEWKAQNTKKITGNEADRKITQRQTTNMVARTSYERQRNKRTILGKS
jgi:hypothetical protein